MQSTSPSLLARLRPPADQAAWVLFVDLYTLLLFHWARRSGLQESDAADLAQDVFQTLVRKMPGFTCDGDKTFRGWLRTVVLNQWRTHRRRAVQPLDEDAAGLAVPDDVDAVVETEYRNYLISRTLQVRQTDFRPSTWGACWEHVGRGRPAAEVAAELGLSVKAVYLAKARVLRRLREELEGLWA